MEDTAKGHKRWFWALFLMKYTRSVHTIAMGVYIYFIYVKLWVKWRGLSLCLWIWWADSMFSNFKETNDFEGLAPRLYQIIIYVCIKVLEFLIDYAIAVVHILLPNRDSQNHPLCLKFRGMQHGVSMECIRVCKTSQNPSASSNGSQKACKKRQTLLVRRLE